MIVDKQFDFANSAILDTLKSTNLGDFEKKNSCKRLSEEKNCMQHKCNRKLTGKKGKTISCPPDC